MKVGICKNFISPSSEIVLLIILIFSSSCITAQQSKIDSLKHAISYAKADTLKIILLEQLGQSYRDEKKIDSSIMIYKQALELNEKINYSLISQRWELACIDYMAYVTGNYAESLNYALRELAVTEKMNDKYHMGYVYLVFGHNYKGLGDYRKSLNTYFKAKHFFTLYNQSEKEPEVNTYTILCISEVYLKMNQPDSALLLAQQAYDLALADPGYSAFTKGNSVEKNYILYSMRVLGDVYFIKGNDQTGLNYYRQYISGFINSKENNRDLGFVFINMSKIFKKRGLNDSAIYYAKKALSNAEEYHDEENIYNASDFLYRLHDSLNDESQAFMYFKIAVAAKDSMLNLEKTKQIQVLISNEQTREKVLEEVDAKEAARITLATIIAAFLISIISFLIWNRIRQLRLKHKMILEQKEAEKLRAIDKMKEKFFSNITHELRTPLSLILSPTEFYLAHPEELNDTNNFLKSVYKNSAYLLNLINQLLDISKLDAGKMFVSLAKGDFGNYIGVLTETFEDEATKKQIDLHFKNNLEGNYLFDEEHWKKIVNNMLGNALKFTPPGGDVFMQVNPISESAESSTIQLVVKDTGIGIDEDYIPFITDRFYQADNNLSRKYEGAGIGLALVNELAKLMDGKLTIRSEKNNGSEFTITATLLCANGKKDYPEITPVAKTFQILHNDTNYANTFKGPIKNIPVILVTEDNDELREFLKDSIEPLYKIITAKDGRDGYEKALSQIPDLIISDLMMPVMDGFEFCGKIKMNPATSHTPFIVLSAKTTYESKMAGLKKGADDYLTKPFSVDELQTKIKNILSRQEQLRKRYLELLMDENPLPSASEMQNEFLKKTFRIIEEHIDDSQLSVEFLATKLGLDNNTLNRKSSFLIGLSANELIRQYRVKKEKMERQMLELEAKALRAQMNPHFIFNCMNSIKSLIQQNDQDKAVTYLTTFSKLLRTVFQNSDQREISLHDEIETCKLYTQLESMRFSNKFNYHFKVDETIDLKSVQVPALIVQPFIENAIWHGIVPKTGGGTVTVTIEKRENNICCIIDDDGIGREMSQQNKFRGEPSTHQSKGVHLTQSRLDLDNALNQRNRFVKIIDKKKEDEKSNGTTVILTFKED